MLKKVCLSMTLALAAAHTSAENVPYDQAKEAGVVKCLPMIRKVAQFLHEEKNHGAHSTWARAAPDKQMFSQRSSERTPMAPRSPQSSLRRLSTAAVPWHMNASRTSRSPVSPPRAIRSRTLSTEAL